jgi:hypothetical protein
MTAAEVNRLSDAFSQHLLKNELRLLLYRCLPTLSAFAPWTSCSADGQGKRQEVSVRECALLAADAVVLSVQQPHLEREVTREHLLLAAAVYSAAGALPLSCTLVFMARTRWKKLQVAWP